MDSDVPVNSAPSRKPRTWLFPAIVIGLLAAQVLLCAVVIFIATSDPSFAVEEDYYAKALNWDKTKAARAASTRLGWRPILIVSPTADDYKNREITMRLFDAEDQLLTGVTATAIAFQQSRGDERQTIAFQEREDEPGVYQASLPVRRTGRWQFRLTAERGADAFQQTIDMHIASPTGVRP